MDNAKKEKHKEGKEKKGMRDLAREKRKSFRRRRESSGRCKDREMHGRKGEKTKGTRDLGVGLMALEKGKSPKHQRKSSGRCKERET